MVLFLLRAAIRAILKLMMWFSDTMSAKKGKSDTVSQFLKKKGSVCCSSVISYSFFFFKQIPLF